ncbi:MAG: TIGR03364 family FAD-dependent oxidoreductase [Bacteroidota bacterium]|nr:TIGR03364 family FAD-dependent oxidoreductase [Bacteroidota bacterium]
MHKSAIIIGAGIVGLATARALAVRGYKVNVIERTHRAVGASIRNFGMIWPIGQPDGKLYERVMLSRSIWKQVCNDASIWHDEVGSLHVAYQSDEMNVLKELAEIFRQKNYQLLSPDETAVKSSAVVRENLAGSLYSPDEMIVDPRVTIQRIPEWLSEKYKVEFAWGKAVTDIVYPDVYTGGDMLSADEIFLCSGADFETLYPDLFAEQALVKCKLQMMRMAAQPERIGPPLCGALSLVHYNSFKAASSLGLLKKRFEVQYPDYLKWGIHVMVAQNQAGELTVGDSHEYDNTHDPFDKQFINQLILDYLKTFARFSKENIIETWNGIYPKLTNGETDLVIHPEQGVTIINGLGGAGMTLGFGLAEQVIAKKY